MICGHHIPVKGVCDVAGAPVSRLPGVGTVEETFDQLASRAPRDRRVTQHAPAPPGHRRGARYPEPPRSLFFCNHWCAAPVAWAASDVALRAALAAVSVV